jgi:hypothetical protein
MRITLFSGAYIMLCAVVLCGCGPRTATPISALKAAPQTPAADTGAAPAAGRNTLRAVMPALGKLAIGTEFDYVLCADMVDALYQGSGRVLYDSRILQPLAAAWGPLAPPAGVRVAKLDATAGATSAGGLNAAVPFAFTALPGQSAAAPGQGEILRLRFKLIGAVRDGVAIRLQNDPALLQLRDSQGQRLSFNLCEEAGAK